MITLRNKFDALQEISETSTPNNEYENFINAHIEAAAECIPSNLEQNIVPWETLAVEKKNVTTTSLYNMRNPNNANAQKLKKT